MSTPQTAAPVPPPFAVRLHNARLAAGRVLARAMHGGRFGVSSVESDRRLAICEDCKTWFIPADWVCAHPSCGCFLKVKARLATETCPEGKWVVLAKEVPGRQVLLGGDRLFEKELELRMILPPSHLMVQTYNKFHEDNLRGGCYSCRRNAYGRTLAAALLDYLNTASPADVARVRTLFPDTTHLEGVKVARAWSSIGKGSLAPG